MSHYLSGFLLCKLQCLVCVFKCGTEVNYICFGVTSFSLRSEAGTLKCPSEVTATDSALHGSSFTLRRLS